MKATDKVSTGDRVRLLRPIPSRGIEVGEEGYASTDYGAGGWREEPLWSVWIYRLQEYVPVEHGDLELVARYIPGRASRTPRGDYVYADPGRFVNPDGTPYEWERGEERGVIEDTAKTDGPLTLRGHSLLSKWGFGDGDAVWDWHYDRTDEPPPEDPDHHDVLAYLVEKHLLPLIEGAGHTYEVERIGTAHNPIRLRTLDGSKVRQLEPIVDSALDAYEVHVEPDEVWAVSREMAERGSARPRPPKGEERHG